MTPNDFDQFIEGVPEPIADRLARVTSFVRNGGEAIELVLRADPMIIGSRTIEQAIADTRVETQNWALAVGGPVDYKGTEIIYRTRDCCEADGSKFDSADIFVDGAIIASCLHTVATEKVPGHPNRTPLKRLSMHAAHLFDLENEGIDSLRDDLPTASDYDVAAFIETNGAKVNEATQNDLLMAVEVGLLLRPAMSRAFARDFAAAFSHAKINIHAIPNRVEVFAEYMNDDEESEAPLNMDYYSLLSDAATYSEQLFRPVFARHSVEWIKVFAVALLNPGGLGFEPPESAFRE